MTKTLEVRLMRMDGQNAADIADVAVVVDVVHMVVEGVVAAADATKKYSGQGQEQEQDHGSHFHQVERLKQLGR